MASPTITSTLRGRRSALGLSQSELAERVGVSRQALIAIEAGRQVPSTALALGLARALGCRVEDLFALAAPAELRASLAAGAAGPRVALGRVDGRWVAHGIDEGARASDGLLVGEPSPAGEVSVEPLVDPGALVANVLVSGCAPLLGLLAARLARRGPGQRATWIPAGSGRSLELLARDQVHLAGLHLVEADRPGGHAAIVRERFPDRASLIVNLTRWRQGLVVAPGNPLGVQGVADLLREDLRFVGREPGSGAERLVARLLDELGLCAGSFSPPAKDHAEVARRVRWGAADVGVAIEAAAIAEGLDFIPLAEERFDLLVPRERAELPEVAALLELIDGRSFRSEAARLPGYDLREAGHAATVEAHA